MSSDLFVCVGEVQIHPVTVLRLRTVNRLWSLRKPGVLTACHFLCASERGPAAQEVWQLVSARQAISDALEPVPAQLNLVSVDLRRGRALAATLEPDLVATLAG